jgi:two-component system sensor histidine kinase TctE
MTGGTLRRQVLMWVSLPLGVLWLVSAWVDYDIAKRFVTVAYDRALLESALDIGRQVRVLRGRIYVDLPEVAIQMLRSRESGSLYYRVTGPGGEFVTGEPDLAPAAARPIGQPAYYDDHYRGQTVRVAVINLPVETEDLRGEVTVQVVEAQSARHELLREVLLRMALPQFLLALLALALIWFAVRRGLAPLQALRREIEQRSHRDLSALPVANVPAEVRPIVESTNALLGRLAAALDAQQRFIADAAHQLRTPIAGIYTQTQLARRQATADGIAASLQQLQNAAERATHLVNQLLTLARAEPAAESTQRLERLDLAALARDVTMEWVPRALERNIDLGFEGDSNLPAMAGDRLLLQEMLNNLIDNAVCYTQPGGRVTTRVARDHERLCLTVEDNGPGIPEAEREAVLERFYRVLGTGVDGCGLGLAIVREIVARHGGDIHLLAATDGKGTRAQITFAQAA